MTGHPDLRADLVELLGLAARLHLDTAGCDTCGHLSSSHEPDDYDADGAPVRPICCVPGCRCGEQWRNP